MARVTVHVHTRASRNAVRREPDGTLSVWVTAPPVENRANETVCQVLARRLQIAASRVQIVLGLRSHTKVIEIHDVTEQALGELLLSSVPEENTRQER